jgi:hypothetical protein
MKKYITLLRREWRKVLLFGAVLLAVSSVLMYRLVSLLPGVSSTELAAQNSASSLQQILNEPLYFPYKLAQLAVIKAGFYGPLAMRLISVVVALLGALLFYFLLRRWFTRRLSLFGTLALVTSGWFLSSARLAVPSVLLILSPVLLIHLFLLLMNKQKIGLLLLIMIGVLLGMCLYVPGSLYIVVGMILFNWKKFVAAITRNGATSNILLAILLCVLLLPVVLASIQNSDTMKQLLLLPLDTSNLVVVLKSTYQTPLQLFARSSVDQTHNLGTLPLLDFAEVAFLILGIFFVKKKISTKKMATYLLTTLLALVIVGVSAKPENGDIFMIAAFGCVSAGLTFLLQQWLTVFPRNPLARLAGVGLVILVIATSSGYQLTRYFVAWPQAPETRTAFRFKM